MPMEEYAVGITSSYPGQFAIVELENDEFCAALNRSDFSSRQVLREIPIKDYDGFKTFLENAARASAEKIFIGTGAEL